MTWGALVRRCRGSILTADEQSSKQLLCHNSFQLIIDFFIFRIAGHPCLTNNFGMDFNCDYTIHSESMRDPLRSQSKLT